MVEQAKNLSLLNSSELQSSVNNIIEKYSDLYFTNESSIINSFINSKLFNQLDFGYITELLNNIVSSLGSFSIGLFTIIFITFFFLKDSDIILEKLKILIIRLSSIGDIILTTPIIRCLKQQTDANIDFLTIGQYLQPTVKHHPIDRFYEPKEFEELEKAAYGKGFLM